MSSDKDKAIRENIKKVKTMNTFLSNVSIDGNENDCHVWQGKWKEQKGYGYFPVYFTEKKKSVNVRAHRFAYAMYYGADALPAGVEGGNRQVLNHLCFNRLCVNPLHLEVVTNAQNVSPNKRKQKNA